MNVAKRTSVWLCKTFNKTATLILTRKKKNNTRVTSKYISVFEERKKKSLKTSSKQT